MLETQGLFHPPDSHQRDGPKNANSIKPKSAVINRIYDLRLYIDVQDQVKNGFGIQVRHWIDLSAGTEFFSLPKLLTKICP